MSTTTTHIGKRHKCHKKNPILGKNANLLKDSSEDSTLQTDQVTDTSDVPVGTYNLSLYFTAYEAHHVNSCVCPVGVKGILGASSATPFDIQWQRFQVLAPRLVLNDDNLPCVCTNSGECIKPLGKTTVQVSHPAQQKQLPILVLDQIYYVEIGWQYSNLTGLQ